LRAGEKAGNDIISTPNYNPLQTYPNATGHRANATFVLLARNSDLVGVLNSMQSAEDRFNRYYNYPWVLLNEEPFTEEFKEYVYVHSTSFPPLTFIFCVYRRVSVLTRAPISFGLIPKEHWFQPDWIDEERARAGRQKMMAQRIIYGGKLQLSIAGNTSLDALSLLHRKRLVSFSLTLYATNGNSARSALSSYRNM